PILRPFTRPALRHAHERPAAAQPLAVQLEVELAVGEPAFGIGERQPIASVPDHHRPCAVLGLRNLAFEGRVLEWVILGAYGEAAVLRIVARLLRNRPALQNAAVLEPEVVMESRGVVPLHDEVQLASSSPRTSTRLRRAPEIALALVGIELGRHTSTSLR